jgi:hypothetical protein
MFIENSYKKSDRRRDKERKRNILVLTGRTGVESSALKDGDKQGKLSRFEVAKVKVSKNP